MTRKELAELLLSSRKAARLIESTVALRDDRLLGMGFSRDDISKVVQVVEEIEEFTELLLATLERQDLQ